MSPASSLQTFAIIRLARARLILSLAVAVNLLFVVASAQEFVPDELIVVFGPKVGGEHKKGLHKARGHSSLKEFHGINGHLVKLKEKESIEDAIADYRRDPRVLFAEPNYIVHAVATANDYYFNSLWAFRNTGQTIGGVLGKSGADIRATQAWNITTGSETIVVGVVDSGVNYTHPDLALNIWSNPGGINDGPAGSHGYNAIAKNFDPKDDAGHGTQVAGIIGALGNNSLGSVGVNWRVSIMPLKFLGPNGSGTIADAIDAIGFAIDAKKSGVNVRVLNNSWGSPASSQALLNQIRLAGENDILFVAAAGNTSSNNDLFNFYPANADAPNVIAVAATDNNDLLAAFSNFGANSVELGAPGVYILSTYFTPSTGASGYVWGSGTSMASPQVAGAAALVLANGYQTVTTLRQTLLSSVDRIPSLAAKTITGGRLNVYNALLAMAVSVTPVSPALNPGETLVLNSSVIGGTPPYTYAWSNSTGPLFETGPSISIDALDTYYCTVTDSSVPPKTATGSSTPTKPAPIITWPTPGDIAYGSSLTENQLNASAALPGTFVYSPPVGSTLPVGRHALSVTFTPDDPETYSSATESVYLNVNKAPLQIQANNASKLYGAAVPDLTASYSGFVNGESVASLTTLPTLATTGKANSPAGSYPITPSGAAAANYNIAYLPGVLTVDPAPLTITAVAKTKNYGASLPSFSVTYSGFVNGDTYYKLTTPVTYTTTATKSSPVGVYPITPGGATSSNYSITFINSTLTINPVPLKITAYNKSKTYGKPLPAFTASYSGFANGDTVLNLTTPPVFETTATIASPIGLYPITVSGATSGNYTITFLNGTLTNTPARLTIYAQSKSKYYGAVLPALTASYSGFVNGDTIASLLTPAVLETSASQSSPVGSYPITVSGATAANYTVKFVNSLLTVKPAPLYIRAVSKSKIYGANLPALTYTITGFVLGETDAILTSPVTAATVATAASVVGSYPITVSGAAAPNYAPSYSSASLSVSKAPLSVKADSLTKLFGTPIPPLTYTIAGFVNGDTEEILDVPVLITTTATSLSPPGSYSITPKSALDANYNISFISGILKIIP